VTEHVIQGVFYAVLTCDMQPAMHVLHVRRHAAWASTPDCPTLTLWRQLTRLV